jgi:sensor c-di-GMP phosphodiesterase-like protein
MTRTLKQRALFTLAITALTIAVGVAGGYLLGCAVVLRATHSDMELYALRVQDQAATFAKEDFNLLAAANASHFPYCSEDERAYFRTLIFHAEFITDMGLIRGGKIECSAIMGRLKRPLTAPPVDAVIKISLNSYTNYRYFPPFEGNIDNHATQLGDYYVVMSNYRYSHLGPDSIQFIRLASRLNPELIRQIWGVKLNIDQHLLNRNGTLWRNGTLYVTRCTTDSLANDIQSCTTTYIPTQAALQFGRSQVLICTAAGGLVGLCLGLFCSVIYRRSLGMERQLLQAIRKDELQVVYQPIVELASGRIVEAEALARWTDADGFAVSPAIFVPIAEECGYVCELTVLVIRRTLRDLSVILQYDPAFRMNVNVTAMDLANKEFLPILELSLAEAGVEARNLAIEVTESSTAKGQIVRETIHQLRERGHSVKIDDFGTGYSSLSYLRDLSVDAIKIDRSFTQAIGTEAVTVGILPQILAMAKALKLQVIAEGIETVEQAGYFAGSEMNILGQGWLFGYPMAAQGILDLLSEAEKKNSFVE